MDHTEAERLLKPYRAGTLERESVRRLHAHFKDCEACRSRIRLERAHAQGGRDQTDRGLTSPLIQKQIAQNRDLLIKILFLGILAWAVFKYRH